MDRSTLLVLSGSRDERLNFFGQQVDSYYFFKPEYGNQHQGSKQAVRSCHQCRSIEDHKKHNYTLMVRSMV